MHRRYMTKKRKPRVKKVKVLKIETPTPDENIVVAALHVDALPEDISEYSLPVEVEPEVHHENSWVKWFKSIW